MLDATTTSSHVMQQESLATPLHSRHRCTRGRSEASERQREEHGAREREQCQCEQQHRARKTRARKAGSRAHPSFVKPSWRVTEIHPCAEATRADSRILRILVNVRYWPVRAREVAQGFVKPSWRVTEIHDCEL